MCAGGLRKWVPFPSKEMTLREQTGGKRVLGGGGVQNRFWGGV